MKSIAALAFVLIAAAGICRAEPRWCSVTPNQLSSKLDYPPIAHTAGVSGVVLVRVIYVPNGKVESVEPVSGPRLLSRLLTNQIMEWTVKTDSTGDALCETLVAVDFRLADEPDSDQPGFPIPSAPSILHLSATASPDLFAVENVDPAPLRGWRLARATIRKTFRRVFASQ